MSDFAKFRGFVLLSVVSNCVALADLLIRSGTSIISISAFFCATAFGALGVYHSLKHLRHAKKNSTISKENSL